MPYKKLRIETRDRVGYILLDAGLRFNKLSITTIRELKRAFAQVVEDESTHAIVLSGYPGESFAERIASHPLLALSAAKRLVTASEDTDLRTGCLLEREAATHINSPHRS